MIRRIRPEEYESVHDMVISSFNRYVASYFSERGNQSFYDYADIKSFTNRLKNNYEAFVIEEDGAIVGMTEIKSREHISMLFVDPESTLSGHGRALVEFAIDYCRSTRPFIQYVTVNASPYAVNFYKKMGFLSDGPPSTHMELTSYPMIKLLVAEPHKKKFKFNMFKKKYDM